MSKNIVETLLGTLIVLVAAAFLIYAYSTGYKGKVGGYELQARFDRIDGLSVGNDVRVSGLQVGNIVEQTIDPQTYEAVVTFTVRDDIQLPADSSAEIISDGLLGGKYLALVPGAADEMLKDGDNIIYTQSAISIEQLIGKFIYGSGDEEEENSSESGGSFSTDIDASSSEPEEAQEDSPTPQIQSTPAQSNDDVYSLGL